MNSQSAKRHDLHRGPKLEIRPALRRGILDQDGSSIDGAAWMSFPLGKWLEQSNLVGVGGWPTPLKNMKFSWDDYSQLIWKNKKCLKPPTRLFTYQQYGTYKWEISSDTEGTLRILQRLVQMPRIWDIWYFTGNVWINFKYLQIKVFCFVEISGGYLKPPNQTIISYYGLQKVSLIHCNGSTESALPSDFAGCPQDSNATSKAML